jgi:2-oxoisovalerate dehydrogenase E1 component
MEAHGRVAVCALGDATARQGEFYEAWCFAIQEGLPVVFVLEDNRYGISTRTNRMNPLRLGVLSADRVERVDGKDPDAIFDGARRLIS